MPIYDFKCPSCGAVRLDIYLPRASEPNPVCACHAEMQRTHIAGQKAHAVVADSIPGGIYIKHGLCHDDGTPRRFDSHTDINKAAKEKGLTNVVRHIPIKKRGTDKSVHTTRWT